MHEDHTYNKSHSQEDFMAVGWKELVGKVAPMLGTALGGPLAGAAVSAVGKALGLGETAEESQVEQSLARATPEQLMALKQAEADFRLRMAELGFKNETDLEKLAADDRASARNREIQLRDWMPKALGMTVTVGFLGLLLFMILRRNAQDFANKDLLNVMLGALATAWASIINYYFGSSAGSAAKTEIIGKKLQSQSGPPDPA
jgi:hypothetical protein